MSIFQGKRILITGGTGSLGKTLVHRFLNGDSGIPERIVVFSRDEAKQHQMRLDFLDKPNQTDEAVYQNFRRLLQFRIGDVRDFNSVSLALQDIDIVINAAALKQVPTCEYFPFEAVQTNVVGANNIVNAIQRGRLPVETLVGISTDKAVLPVNVMGMTKALQERLLVAAQLALPDTRIQIVRYGNVVASRGSVIPLFRQQIRGGGPVTVTDPSMTRFLFTLSQAVDTIFAAIRTGKRGETFVPRIPSGRILDVAKAMIGERKIEIRITGIRPGEKIHEVLISREESARLHHRDGYYVVGPMLPELGFEAPASANDLWEYSSGTDPLDYSGVQELLTSFGLAGPSSPHESEEMELLR
jgi:FlaA1/EpsC-like NDP-sugar epimerase